MAPVATNPPPAQPPGDHCKSLIVAVVVLSILLFAVVGLAILYWLCYWLERKRHGSYKQRYKKLLVNYRHLQQQCAESLTMTISDTSDSSSTVDESSSSRSTRDRTVRFTEPAVVISEAVPPECSSCCQEKDTEPTGKQEECADRFHSRSSIGEESMGKQTKAQEEDNSRWVLDNATRKRFLDLYKNTDDSSTNSDDNDKKARADATGQERKGEYWGENYELKPPNAGKVTISFD